MRIWPPSSSPSTASRRCAPSARTAASWSTSVTTRQAAGGRGGRQAQRRPPGVAPDEKPKTGPPARPNRGRVLPAHRAARDGAAPRMPRRAPPQKADLAPWDPAGPKTQPRPSLPPPRRHRSPQPPANPQARTQATGANRRPSSSSSASPATACRPNFRSRSKRRAAVFQRADMVWLIFDSPAKIDLAALQRRWQPRDPRRPRWSAAPTAKRSCASSWSGRAWLVSSRTARAGSLTIGDTVRGSEPAARHRPQHRRHKPRQPRHSVRPSAQSPCHRRPRHRRPAAGGHRARAGARILEGAEFRRIARAAVHPGRGVAAARRRRHRRASRSTRSPSPVRAGCRCRRR